MGIIKHVYRLGFIIVIGLSWVAQSCNESLSEEIDGPDFEFRKPAHFPNLKYDVTRESPTLAKFNLGKRLFFDPSLSLDGTIACSSCHVQSVAFADPQHRLSLGIGDKIGRRNSPAIQNIAFMDRFFADGGVTHVDFISINPIEDPAEMGEDIGNVVSRLNTTSSYVSAFREAFGTDTITTPFLLKALSNYMIMLVSDQSRYDAYVKGDSTVLTDQELQGLRLFESKCSACHEGVLFTDQGFRNNGLDSVFVRDKGRSEITENDADDGKFKVPSLRNVAVTSPYMHDGRFRSLQEVLEHYNSGVVSSKTLDPLLENKGRSGIAINEQEQEDIIAFLETLTDHDFLNNDLFKRN